jgi:hypothetical protein
MPPLSSLLFPCCAAEVVARTACVCLLAAFEVRLLGFFVIVYSLSKFLGLLLHDILGSMLPATSMTPERQAYSRFR